MTIELVGTISPTSDAIEVKPDAATFEVSSSATLNSRTYVDDYGVLHIQKTGLESGDTVTVTATATYINPSAATSTFTDTLTITIA